MKTLRWILMAMAVPAGVLFGVTRIGDTSISKGYDTGFTALVGSSPTKLTLSTDTGDLMCWLRLRIPVQASTPTAKLSTGTSLFVYPEAQDGTSEWIAIVADGQKPEEKFKWPSGSNVVVYSTDSNPNSLK